ncbi:MAG: dihydroorotate dehydrogenase electron transfer subunit [Clostridiales bacterium]|nr:dihydroorotate dehydrogenase electron transfer subunit [Clostridiales bacterium]
MKKLVNAQILKNAPLTRDIYELIFKSEYLAETAKAGQFAGIYLESESKLLPRPFGFCQTDAKAGTVRIVYRVVGGGTKILSQYPEGKTLRVLGPCGNGFTYSAQKRVVIIGGGMGTPPLLKLAQDIKKANSNAEINVFSGFQNAQQVILKSDFEKTGAKVYISTDDGSQGYMGNVISLIKNVLRHNPDGGSALPQSPEIIFACGPKVMLKAVSGYADETATPAQVSMEERMGCGVGACICCVTKTNDGNGEAYKKVCAHGPVFSSKEVVWNG